MKMRKFARCLLLMIAALMALHGTQPAAAHTEGKMQLSAASAGPFRITAWTAPDPAQAGDIHVTALLFSAEDAAPILDADVVVFLTPGAGPTAERSQIALREGGANNLYYESIFAGVEPGDYEVRLQMNGADGEVGEATFPLEVVSASRTNWLVVAAIALALVIAAAAILVRRRPRPPVV